MIDEPSIRRDGGTQGPILSVRESLEIADRLY